MDEQLKDVTKTDNTVKSQSIEFICHRTEKIKTNSKKESDITKTSKFKKPRITICLDKNGKKIKLYRCQTCYFFVKKEQPFCNTCLGIPFIGRKKAATIQKKEAESKIDSKKVAKASPKSTSAKKISLRTVKNTEDTLKEPQKVHCVYCFRQTKSKDGICTTCKKENEESTSNAKESNSQENRNKESKNKEVKEKTVKDKEIKDKALKDKEIKDKTMKEKVVKDGKIRSEEKHTPENGTERFEKKKAIIKKHHTVLIRPAIYQKRSNSSDSVMSGSSTFDSGNVSVLSNFENNEIQIPRMSQSPRREMSSIVSDLENLLDSPVKQMQEKEDYSHVSISDINKMF